MPVGQRAGANCMRGTTGSAVPVRLAVIDAVARGLALEGELPLAGLPRLVAALAAGDGTLKVSLRFLPETDCLGRLQGRLDGELQLSCQRCLQPMPWTLAAPFELHLVGSEAEEERLLERFEPVLVEDGQLALHEVLEDEALLALPLAPLHPDGGCTGAAGETSGGEVGDNDRPGDSRPNPFLALKGKFPSR